ncbi:helix-hairpin-helix domain-containing protein [Calothrix sp. UHCC 0171]|uniref:ComEA family DNA-binding protein n=1 Tax=Calothrix sp. UHCC 0171 TaxID=3110245 RepID=UPI002B211912|nr:helix-hairpin-helix domain-containing protein [Calothrix sp. UHCC 0171]MEA5571274.1 helix-hairpin-helix domain-containing protein [Calothrix sp. UHCC 0171]
MMKIRYVFLAVAACAIVSLSSCTGGTPSADNNSNNTSATVANSTPQVTQASQGSHSIHHGGKKININSAILSELDKFEGKLGVPALSNKIQANRPYAAPEELVTKKVITQEQFDKIKEQVTVEEVTLTGEVKDVDYMTKLGLMKGHLIVAKELLEQNKPKDAEPHIGHPVEEIYTDVEEQLNDRKVKEFKTTLISLQDLVKANGKAEQVKTNFSNSMQAVDGAIATLPSNQRSQNSFVLQVINGLLDSANSEYGAAVANGKIAAAIEYQDSRGFVVYANELYQTIASSMARENPEAHKGIEANMAELTKVWSSVNPPTKPVKTPEEVTKLVKAIEVDSQKAIDKAATQASS